MNTAIFSPSGGSVGIGFAIPAQTAENVVNALEHGGVVSRGYLGVNIQPVTPAIAELSSMKSAEGAIVDQVMPGTPAAEAGLKSGDVITKLDGKDVHDASDLSLRVASVKPGAKVQLTYMRDGVEKTVEVTLALQRSETEAKADDAKGNEATPALGIGSSLPAERVAGSGDKGRRHHRRRPERRGGERGADRERRRRRRRRASLSRRRRTSRLRSRAPRAKARRAVLMRIQTAQGDRYVAVPFPKA